MSSWPESAQFLQDSRYAVEGFSLFYPAITVTPSNDVMIHYGRSGDAEYPSLYSAGRQASDERLTLRPSLQLAPGAASWDLPEQAQPRFGDYFGVAIDPVDNTVWTFGQYVVGHCHWGSWIGHVGWSEAGPGQLQFQEQGLTPPRDCLGPP
jgi:hypothetical protein